MLTRAALFRSAGQPLEITEVEIDGPRAGEVVVKMAHSIDENKGNLLNAKV